MNIQKYTRIAIWFSGKWNLHRKYILSIQLFFEIIGIK